MSPVRGNSSPDPGVVISFNTPPSFRGDISTALLPIILSYRGDVSTAIKSVISIY